MNFLRKTVTDRRFTLTAAWTFNQLAYAIVYPFIPLYLTGERGIPYSIVGMIFPLMGIMVMISPLIAGPVTDRFGRMFMMDFGQFARSALFLILACLVWLNASFWIITILLMLNTGVGVAFQVGADAYLTDITEESERPSYYSMIRIGYNLGWALGPMIGAFFAKTPFWLFFLITSGLCFIGGIFTHCTCKPTAKIPQKKMIEQTDSGSILSLIRHKKELMFLLTGSTMLFSLSSQLYSTMSVFAVQRVGISKEALGVIFSINAMQIILFQYPMTAFLKRLNLSLKVQLYAGTLFYFIGYFFLGFCGSAWQIAAAVITLTLGELIAIPSLFASVANQSTTQNSGRILAALSLFRGIGYSVGPWFGAQFFQYMRSSFLLWMTLSSFAVAALILFSLPWRRKNKVS